MGGIPGGIGPFTGGGPGMTGNSEPKGTGGGMLPLVGGEGFGLFVAIMDAASSTVLFVVLFISRSIIKFRATRTNMIPQINVHVPCRTFESTGNNIYYIEI
jgi:hypothetical protein